tara:strand:- start:672 stop:1007 length:336 start_codon:yes stop_codon:yes gene_type:complete
MTRFYYESDGGPGRKEHYVVDKYANPIGEYRRRDVGSRGEGRRLATDLNKNPDRPPWDTKQAKKDGYRYYGKNSLCLAGDGDCEELADPNYNGMCQSCFDSWTQDLYGEFR